MEFFKNRSQREALLLALICVGLWILAIQHDLFEVMIDFVFSHEAYQLDEFVLAAFVAGVGSIIYSVLRVIDLRKALRAKAKAENDVSWLAGHDTLTRLPNRRGLEEVLAQIENEGRQSRCIVHSIDLDGFKKINDLLGHEAGDQTLFEVSRRLQKVYGDMQLFRIGGDEFLALQENSNMQMAERLAQKAIDALATPFTLLGATSEIGASIGIAAVSSSGTLRQTVQNADAAMYVAKRAGRNGLKVFEDSMNEVLCRRIRMEQDLREALREKRIEPYFQPLIDLQSGTIRGFEALARWTGPDGKNVPPIEFVTLAEETGMIVELSEQLFTKACTEAATWPGDVMLAFNISPIQFRDPQLGLRIMQTLDETGLAPTRLEVEITETALVHDLQQAEAILNALHSAGIRIAIDDFGTGYSSLAQLSRFQFDKIKIDRSFVESFEQDEKQAKIMRTLLGLGRGLGLTTTAEGIENESQLKALAELGCDVGQGFLFSRAVPADQIMSLLASEDKQAAQA